MYEIILWRLWNSNFQFLVNFLKSTTIVLSMVNDVSGDKGRDDTRPDIMSSFNPNIISIASTIDTSSWNMEKLKEYQRLMETDKREAIDTYDLACKQLNVLLASSGVILSILVTAILSIGQSITSVMLVASTCFIASSMILSAYASLRSRRIVCVYGYDNRIISSMMEEKQMIVASINQTIKIVDSHFRASE